MASKILVPESSSSELTLPFVDFALAMLAFLFRYGNLIPACLSSLPICHSLCLEFGIFPWLIPRTKVKCYRIREAFSAQPYLEETPLHQSLAIHSLYFLHRVYHNLSLYFNLSVYLLTGSLFY